MTCPSEIEIPTDYNGGGNSLTRLTGFDISWPVKDVKGAFLATGQNKDVVITS